MKQQELDEYFNNIWRHTPFSDLKAELSGYALIDKVKDAQIEARLHFPTILPEVWNLPQPIAEEIFEHITL